MQITTMFQVFHKTVLITAIIYGTVSANVTTRGIQLYDLNEAEGLFKEFVATYKRDYKDHVHDAKYKVFVENLKKINKLNEKFAGMTQYGITQFADMTQEEFLEATSCYNMNDFASVCNMEDSQNYTVPDTLDWTEKGVVTGVKNQGGCGSCWAFSTTGNVESQYSMRYGKTVPLSEQQLVDCTNYGCHGGVPSKAMMYLNTSGGMMSEADYPYVGADSECKLDKSKVVVKVTGCTTFRVLSEDHLRGILHKYGPLSITVNTSGWSHYHGGVLQDSCPSFKLTHAVLLVGYGQENGAEYWLVKNSWGKNWGDQGYIKLVRGKDASCIARASVDTASVE